MDVCPVTQMQEEPVWSLLEKATSGCKVTRTAYLVLKSPLVWACVSIGCVGFCLSYPIALGTVVCLVGAFFFYPESIPAHLLYEVALVDSLARDWLTQRKLLEFPYYNEIFPGMYIGALPLKSHNHHSLLLQNLKVKAILSLVEDFELETEVFFASPVRLYEWKSADVDVCQIVVRDMTMPSVEALHQAADFIKNHETSIYVHCKAGRGRSVVAFIAYLIKHKNMSYDQAYALMASKRPIITLNESQKRGLQMFAEALEKTAPSWNSSKAILEVSMMKVCGFC